MNNKRISIFGERDQELLFKAFAHHVAKITQKSIRVIIAMMHACVHDAITESRITIPDARKLDEQTRKELLESGIDEFLKRSKIGPLQRKEIKNGCMTIYERWRELRSKIRDENDIFIEEILDDETSSIAGYDDQEVLLTAFTHYITAVTGNDRRATARLIRVCMLEVTIPRKINLKDTRFLDETTRMEMIREGIMEYIKRTRTPENQADIILADCLKVYGRWKEIRRVNPEKEEFTLIEVI